MAKKVYDTDGLDMQTTNWSGDENTGGLPVSGRLVEQYIKQIDDQSKPVDELVTVEETKPATAGATLASMVGMVKDIEIDDSGDTQYVMKYKAKDEQGNDVEQTLSFQKYSDSDKVVVNIDMIGSDGSILPASQYIAQGDGFTMRYTVGIGTVGGDEVSGYSDFKARLIMKKGATVMADFRDVELTGVSVGQTYSFNATPYLTDAATYTIQVETEVTYQGTVIRRTVTARITVVAMSLTTSYNVATGLSDGGYKGDITIPMTVKGTSGNKTLYYRLNGGTPFSLSLSAGSGIQQKNISIAHSELGKGLNVIEVYAIHEGSGVKSTYFYISVLNADNYADNYVGLMFSHKADAFQTDYKKPVMHVEQYTAWNFSYAALDPTSNYATVELSLNGSIVKNDRLARSQSGSYGRTNVSAEDLSIMLVCGSFNTNLSVKTDGHSDIEASLSPDAVCTFEAYGRSNSESNANTWKSGGKQMIFDNVLWNVNSNGAGSGWFKDRLLLSGGAGMTLVNEKTDSEGNHEGYYPFNDADRPTGSKIANTGLTIELEYSTANVSDPDARLITCLGRNDQGNEFGLVITAEEAKFLTGVVTEAEDAGETITYQDSVGTKFQPNTNIKITYVFYPTVEGNGQYGLIGFYVNGEESAASAWKERSSQSPKFNFNITDLLRFHSDGADISIKSIRIYDKALTDDEVLNNYIVDRGMLEDDGSSKGVRTLDTENRVLNEGDSVSLDLLMGFIEKRKNSILVLIGTGSVDGKVPSTSDTMNVMDALAQANNKKLDKLVTEARFYNGENRDLDFKLLNAYWRIQGTSSVNYARKNLRAYFQKTAEEYTVTLTYGRMDEQGNQVADTAVTTTGKKNLFRLRANSVGAKLACAKCDFSDSSMTTNTGGAKFINDGLKEMGLLTPAQQYAKDHPDTCKEDIRTAIDGLPCDLFVAKSVDDDFTYYGQYNMNHDKSDSYPVFGMDNTIGNETWGEGETLNYLVADEEGNKQYLPICLETLNNTNDLCLFHWLPSTDEKHESFLNANFDAGFEFNHPKDTFWSDGGGDASEEPNLKEHLGTGDKYDKMYKAVNRMMSFIHKCVKETEACKNISYDAVNNTFTGVDYTDDNNKFPTAKWQSDTFKNEASKYFNLDFLIAYYLYVQFNLAVDQLAKNMLLRTWDGVMWYITYYDGDCQLGSDNKSFLTGKYDDGRQTKRDGSFVMQGHNSWLWNLILGNCSDMITEVLTNGGFRSAFSVQNALNHFDTEQMSRWCSRLYNKSGIFKYIYPYLNKMPNGLTYPQIYGLKGSLQAHRGYFINRRYDLKQVEFGYAPTNGAALYRSTASFESGVALQSLTMKLTIPYRIIIKASNQICDDSGIVDANTDFSLSIPQQYGNENDPLNIIGCEKIKEMVWHEDGFAKGFNFGLFTVLTKLDMSVASASGYRNGSYMTGVENMTMLESLNMANNALARDDSNVTTFNLSALSRLKEVNLKGTGLTSVTLATGCPVTSLVLPATLTELFLENLPNLTSKGLTIDNKSSVIGFRFADCPHIDGMGLLAELHALKQSGKGQLKRFRLKVNMYGNKDLLERYAEYKSYTADGSIDDAHSGLIGTYGLTNYLSDEDLARYRTIYPELEISQPEFTTVMFEDLIDDPKNITNLDNGTKGDEYVASGHILRIREGLIPVFGKLDEKTATWVGERISNDTYRKLANGADFDYLDNTGTLNDAMMRFPACWYKGINDFKNQRKYIAWSSLKKEPISTASKINRFPIKDLLFAEGKAVMVNAASVNNSTLETEGVIADFAGVNSYKLDVSGMKQVRWPGLNNVNIGAVFVDAKGVIISKYNMVVNNAQFDFSIGDYIFIDVPSEAVSFIFATSNVVSGDTEAIAVDSEDVEAIEPDWVYNEPWLGGIYQASIDNFTRMRSVSGGTVAVGTGTSTTSTEWMYDADGYPQNTPLGGMNNTCKDLENLALRRGKGYQLFDYEMSKLCAILFFSMRGNRDAQLLCGYGKNPGGAAGYMDTLGNTDSVRIPNNNNGNKCLGFESFFGCTWEVMDNVAVNVSSWEEFFKDACKENNNNHPIDAIWHIYDPVAKAERTIQGITSSSYCIGRVKHGRYCDVIASKATSDNSVWAANYCDGQWYSAAKGRVVGRSYSYAFANGGVVFAGAYGASSWSSTHIGSRLAFRGKISITNE